MDVRRLPTQSRSSSVVLLVGVIVGLLVAGLAIPFAFGQRLSTTSGSSAAQEELPVEPGAGQPDGGPAALPGPTAGPALPGTPGAGAVAPGNAAPPQGAPAPGASGPGRPGAPGGSGAREPLAATDRGVTAKSVKVGFTVIDTGGTSRVGVGIGITVEQQTAAWQAYAKDINSRGGLLGRQVQPVVVKYDPLSENSQREACLRLTQDEKVFAVAGGFNYPSAVSCVTRENQTPLFSGYPSTSDEIFASSEGRFVTLYPKASRMMAMTVAALDQAGKLEGRTIGILNQMANDPGAKTSAALQRAIEDRGYAVKRRADLSADTGTSSSQVPVTVNQFQQEGIDTVIILAGLLTATQFVQQAESSGYRPAYHLTDWANNNSDVTVQNMPRSFDGTIGTTFIWGHANKLPYGKPNGQATWCKQVHDKHSGRTLAARGTAEYGATMQACDAIHVFERAARAAGARLTRRSIAAVVPSLGSFPVAQFGPGAYRNGKHDFAEQLRFHVFRSSCTCWQPSGGFFSPR